MRLPEDAAIGVVEMPRVRLVRFIISLCREASPARRQRAAIVAKGEERGRLQLAESGDEISCRSPTFFVFWRSKKSHPILQQLDRPIGRRQSDRGGGQKEPKQVGFPFSVAPKERDESSKTQQFILRDDVGGTRRGPSPDQMGRRWPVVTRMIAGSQGHTLEI